MPLFAERGSARTARKGLEEGGRRGGEARSLLAGAPQAAVFAVERCMGRGEQTFPFFPERPMLS